MLFTELRFLPFFLLVFAIHWALRGKRARKHWLLLASYVFYGAWEPRFLGLIVLSTLVDFVAGLKIHAARSAGRKGKNWLMLSLGANLGMLGLFKYYGFFVTSAADLLGVLGFTPHLPTLELILPVGISFYTFQTMSYSLDVYAGRLKPVRSLGDLALFVAFFPQLVAGPIVRAREFLPQLGEDRMLASVDVRAALLLFLGGFIKKACISDNLALFVDSYFATPELFGALAAWTAVLFYTVQIYCDFSGYSDMAIACAALLGFRLVLNFDFPYFATSITQFWRRWHISLSSWLRDYLYIPLGGSRGSRLFTARNLMITMLLGGLWHGAAPHFVVWGGVHGLALVLHAQWRRRVPADSGLGRVSGFLGMPLTFLFVSSAWVFFRAETSAALGVTLRSMLLFESPGPYTIRTVYLAVVPALAIAHWVSYRRWLTPVWRAAPSWLVAGSAGFLIAVALPWIRLEFPPFIYFQF